MAHVREKTVLRAVEVFDFFFLLENDVILFFVDFVLELNENSQKDADEDDGKQRVIECACLVVRNDDFGKEHIDAVADESHRHRANRKRQFALAAHRENDVAENKDEPQGRSAVRATASMSVNILFDFPMSTAPSWTFLKRMHRSVMSETIIRLNTRTRMSVMCSPIITPTMVMRLSANSPVIVNIRNMRSWIVIVLSDKNEAHSFIFICRLPFLLVPFFRQAVPQARSQNSVYGHARL